MTPPSPNSKPVVAIFNTDPFLIQTLTFAMEDEGYNTISAAIPDLMRNMQRGEGLTPAEVIGNTRPQVFVIDVGAHFEKESLIFANQQLIAAGLTGDAKVIFTSTSYQRLRELVPETGAINIEGKPIPGILSKPFDLNELIQAVGEGVREVNEGRLKRQVAEPRELTEPASEIKESGRRGARKRKSKGEGNERNPER